jgi:hypothetical protein
VRRSFLLVGLVACGDTPRAPPPQTFDFGPYALAPGQEVNGQCVSATLDNDEPLYINAVELTTGPGFHHSNWFWVPEGMFDGPDGTWRCNDRGYDEAIAGVNGGVLFAQSTQAQHEVQAFAEGVAIVIPPRSRILAGTHLLNSGDEAVNLSLALKITPIAEPTTKLAAMSLTNESIAIPPMRSSRFTIACDVDTPHQQVLGRPMDFSIYYALAHYHELGRGLTIEAVRGDGTASTVFETVNAVGDALGGTIDPGFSLAGYKQLRFTCRFDNPRTTTVRWGVGDQEMCTFLAFSDSERVWAGGVLDRNTTPTVVDYGAYIEYTYPCTLINSEPNR